MLSKREAVGGVTERQTARHSTLAFLSQSGSVSPAAAPRPRCPVLKNTNRGFLVTLPFPQELSRSPDPAHTANYDVICAPSGYSTQPPAISRSVLPLPISRPCFLFSLSTAPLFPPFSALASPDSPFEFAETLLHWEACLAQGK